MRYRLFGKTGLRVSELCLGAMTFGEEWGWGASKEESRKIFDAFVEAGGNFIDTANVYTDGTSERFIGDFVAGNRQRFVIATKYTSNMSPDDPNAGGNQRKNLFQSLDASLKRLGTDYVDIYWVHAWDPMTPIEEVMRALDDAVRSGKVLYAGISDAPAWVVARANTLAELRGWSPFMGLQVPYSLVERTSERELLPMAQALDLAVTAWAPIGGGVLAGKYKSRERRPDGARFSSSNAWSDTYVTDRNLRIAEEVVNVAREIGRTPSQVAIAWIRQQPRGVILPIVGARALAQMRDNLGCLDLTLSNEQLERLDQVSCIEPGFPNDFLARVRGIVYGDTFNLTDDHRRRS